MKRKLLLVVFPFLLTGCTFGAPSSSLKESSDTDTSSSLSSEDNSTSLTSSGSIDSSSITEIPDEFIDIPQPSDAYIVNSEEYLSFWNPNTKLSFSFSMSKQNIQKMSDFGAQKDNPLNELYLPANLSLTMNNQVYTFEEVGLRVKGNTSRHDFASEGTISSPISFKISFNETWQEEFYEPQGLKKIWTDENALIERDDRTLFGMKKIDIKWNNTNDQSLINQPYVYRLFRKYNEFSPHSTLGTFAFDNGSSLVNMGIMTINEPIDKTFMRRYLSKKSAAGDLYKSLYNTQGMADLTPNNAFYESNGEYFINTNGVGVEDTFNYYHPKYDLKTNEDESTHSALLNLLVTLNTNQYASTDVMKDKLESVVDIDAFLRYAALSYLTGNEDDLRNNGNNYYLYFSPTNGQAYFIPYDYDWSLGVGYDGNGGQVMATISPYHSKMQGSNRDWQHNPLYWYTIIDNQENDNSSKYPLIGEYQSQYAAYVKSFANSEYFSLDAFNKLYQAYYKNYSSFSSDVESHSIFNGVATFTNYHDSMMTTIDNYID